MIRFILLLFILLPTFCFGQGMLPIGAIPYQVSGCNTETTPNDMKTSIYVYADIASDSTLKYIGSKFTGDATSGTVCKVCVTLVKENSPTMDFSVAIWSDSSGKPGSELNNFGSMNAANITGEHCFSTGSVSITNGTAYHVVITASATNATNYFRWTKDESAATMYTTRSSNGSTWNEMDTNRCYMTRLFKQ